MRVYGRFLISTAQALAGAYIVLKVSLLLARCNVIGNAIAYVGSGSLFILVFHKFIQDGTFFVLSKSFGSGYVAAGFSLIFGIVIPLVILEVVQKSCFLSRAMLPVKKCI
jgi:fucose 4-O-acetylase-like acetyltransferase